MELKDSLELDEAFPQNMLKKNIFQSFRHNPHISIEFARQLRLSRKLLKNFADLLEGVTRIY